MAGVDKSSAGYLFRNWKRVVVWSLLFSTFLTASLYIAMRYLGPFGGILGFIILPFLLLFDRLFFHNGCWFIGGAIKGYACPGVLARASVYFLTVLAIYCLIVFIKFTINEIRGETRLAKARERKKNGKKE